MGLTVVVSLLSTASTPIGIALPDFDSGVHSPGAFGNSGNSTSTVRAVSSAPTEISSLETSAG